MASTFVLKIRAFTATFLFNFFSSGTIIFNSVLYESIENSDGFSSTSTGLLFMLPYTTSRILGPAVCVAMDYFNPRLLTVLGAFLFGSGCCSSGLLPVQAIYLFPCFILSGIGLACMNLPFVWYLEKTSGTSFRSLMPLAMSGSYAGMVIIPNIAAFVKQEYGTGAALLLFGAAGWNLVPCGLFLPSLIPAPCHDNDQCMTGTSQREQLRENRGKKQTISESDDRKNNSIYLMSSKDAVLKILIMLVDESFVFFLFTVCLRKIPNDAWTLFLIPRVHDSGLSLQMAATVSSTGGLGGIFGRFLAGFSFGYSENASLTLFGLYFIINGLIFIVTETLLINFRCVWPLCLISFCTGMLLSAQSGMVAGVLHLFIKSEQFVAAYGLIELGNSICALLAGLVPGLLLDSIGFQAIFIALGIISFVNGCFVFVIVLIMNSRNR